MQATYDDGQPKNPASSTPPVTPTDATTSSSPGQFDVREATYNSRAQGPAQEIAVRVEEVAAIHGFMIDLDCKIMSPDVLGEAAIASSEALYSEHVQNWLAHDPVLAKAEVRDTGGGLHVIAWLDTPILCEGEQAASWHEIAKGLRHTLPCDPSLNGIIAMTRPIGALNTKYDPPREVRRLREGQPVTREEILDLARRVVEQPAHLWMQIFFGGGRASPCPLCAKGASLGVAGKFQCQCYECGRVDAAVLLYRLFSSEFLANRKKEMTNG
jgi:hypothetical protein